MKQSDLHFVYFLADEHGNVKIGTTYDLGARIASLRTANAGDLNLLGYIALPNRDGAFEVESLLHRLLSDANVSGEWYDLQKIRRVVSLMVCRSQRVDLPAKEQSVPREKQQGQLEPLAISTEEAARVLGVSRPTVYQLMGRADFPSFKIGSRSLISVEGLRQWITKQNEEVIAL